METFNIIEFDKDYHAITNREKMKFKNRIEAQKWCDKNSWSGESYFIGGDE